MAYFPNNHEFIATIQAHLTGNVNPMEVETSITKDQALAVLMHCELRLVKNQCLLYCDVTGFVGTLCDSSLAWSSFAGVGKQNKFQALIAQVCPYSTW